MKRILHCLSLLLILILLPSAVSHAAAADVDEQIASIPEDWPEAPEISSPCAIVMDADSGTILYAKNATGEHYPASTTKIMTALLAIENGNLGDTVVFSNAAVNSLPPGSSHIAMMVGEELSMQDCLYGLLLPSANEVANALAEYTAGSISAFTELMNQRAAEIGTVHTHFSNPTGLHEEDHYTCAYDLAIIMRECVQNATFRTIDATPTYIIPITNKHSETRPIGSTHNMLRSNSEYYDSRVIGGKTGWTEESGRNLVTYAYDNGIHLIVVTLGAETPYQYTDTKKLLDYAFSSFTSVSAASQDSSYGTQTDGGNLLNLPRNPLQLFQLDDSSRIILPNTVSFAELTSAVTQETDGSSRIVYSWHGYPLGSAALQQLDLTTADFETGNSLLPENLHPLYHLNLWYIILAAAALLLIVLIIFQLRHRRQPGITFRKKRR